MYFDTAKVQYERSVFGTIGINTISTRKKKSVYFVRSVLFGTDLTKCTDFFFLIEIVLIPTVG